MKEYSPLDKLLKEAEEIKSRLLSSNPVGIQPDLDWLFQVIHKIADLKR